MKLLAQINPEGEKHIDVSIVSISGLRQQMCIVANSIETYLELNKPTELSISSSPVVWKMVLPVGE